MAAASSPVTLDEAEHVYRRDGKVVPGVTGILRQIDELEGIPADVLERAAHFGKHVHLACHLHNVGQLEEGSLDPALRPYLDGWKRFLKECSARVIESERQVYHPTLRYAGKYDALVSWSISTLPVLVDIKSSVTVPRSTGPQTALYREARLAEEPGMQIAKARYAVHLTGDGRFKLKRLSEYARDLNIALSCLNILRWMEAA